MPIDPSRFDALADLQDKFEQASIEGGNYELPPDGTYQAVIDGFDFIEAKSDGALYLKTEITVQHHPDHGGRRADTLHQLNDPDRVQWLKQHLDRIGVDVTSLDITQVRPGSQVLHEVCDTPVQITIKTSSKTDKDGKPYRNVYVDKRLGGPLSDIPSGAPVTASSAAGAADDDKIPFLWDGPRAYDERYHANR